MAKVDPDLVRCFLECDDQGKLAMLFDMDTDTRETLIEFLDIAGLHERMPPARRKTRKVQKWVLYHDGTCGFEEVEEEVDDTPVSPQPTSERPTVSAAKQAPPGVLTRASLATPHLLAVTFDRAWENFPGPYLMVEQADSLLPPVDTAVRAYIYVSQYGPRMVRGAEALQRTLAAYINEQGNGLSWRHAVVHHEYDEDGEWFIGDDRVEATLQYRDGRVRLVIQSPERAPPLGRISARFADGRVIAGSIDIETWRLIAKYLPAIENEDKVIHYEMPPPNSLKDREHTEGGYLIGDRPQSAFSHLPRQPALPRGTWMSR